MMLEEDNPASDSGQAKDEEIREGDPQKDALGGLANAPSKKNGQRLGMLGRSERQTKRRSLSSGRRAAIMVAATADRGN